jgi:hypothetical protein
MKRVFLPLFAIMLLAPIFASAQHTQFTSQLQHSENVVYGEDGGAPTIGGTIGIVIKGALSIVGVLFLAITVYGGFLWMTAGGNDAQVAKAKSLLARAIIGLTIITASYAITTFVIEALNAPASISA